MNGRDRIELLALAAIWGASFLFMRISAEPFGPSAMVFVRVAGAAALLLPLLVWRGEAATLRQHWRPILIVGISNSALPFLLFGYALLHVTASLAAMFNAATPLFGAVIARLWLGDRLDGRRVLGLLIGFAGVFGLAYERAGLRGGGTDPEAALAVGACLLASLSYGFSASYTKRHLIGTPPLALAAGSQIAASLVLALPALTHWPQHSPSIGVWSAALVLAFVCTGAAYVLFFRLIANAGPANALTVTYLVPLFAMLWGSIFLGERPTLPMMIGGALILSGTALATGWRRVAAAGGDRPPPANDSGSAR